MTILKTDGRRLLGLLDNIFQYDLIEEESRDVIVTDNQYAAVT